MIQKVFTETIVYTSESDDIGVNGKTLIPNCVFEQTSYGSIIINRPTSNSILELYPSKISHIIHYKECKSNILG